MMPWKLQVLTPTSPQQIVSPSRGCGPSANPTWSRTERAMTDHDLLCSLRSCKRRCEGRRPQPSHAGATMSARFKVGDKVKVLRAWAGLNIGAVATVHAIHCE